MNSVRFPDAHGTRESEAHRSASCVGFAYGAGVSVQDDAPAAPGLLIELVHFKRNAGLLGKFRQQPIGQRTEVDGALVHGVRDRQDLREIGGLPCDTTQMMRLDKIKALLAPDRIEVALRLSSKSGLPAADGLIMGLRSSL